MHRPRALAVVGCLLLALALPSVASAHAELVSSVPAEGEVVTVVLAEAFLVFDEPLSGGTFEVFDANGARMTAGGVDPADPTTMRAVLPAMGAGRYEMRWTALTDDGGVERGTVTFDVAVAAPPVGSPSVTPSLVASNEPTIGPTEAPPPSPAPTGDGASAGDATGDVLLPIAIVGLLIGGGLALLLRRRAS